MTSSVSASFGDEVRQVLARFMDRAKRGETGLIYFACPAYGCEGFLDVAAIDDNGKTHCGACGNDVRVVGGKAGKAAMALTINNVAT
jgi:hypothetical protein